MNQNLYKYLPQEVITARARKQIEVLPDGRESSWTMYGMRREAKGSKRYKLSTPALLPALHGRVAVVLEVAFVKLNFTYDPS